MTSRPLLVIMVREPRAGRVKTRLARDIGEVAALRAYRLMVARAVRLGRDPRWRTVLAVTPDTATPSRALPPGTPRIAQGSGDLGRRLQRVFDTQTYGPVVVIGTDIPGITRLDIAAAFRALGRSDAVIGPSGDGGYWLIGLKRRPRVVRPFAAVRWSTHHALSDTERNLSGLRIERLRALDDVDTGADYARVKAIIGRLSAGAPRALA